MIIYKRIKISRYTYTLQLKVSTIKRLFKLNLKWDGTRLSQYNAEHN